MLIEIERARDALYAIPPDLPRDGWVKAGMAAHACGLGFDDFNLWSAPAPSYNAQACRTTWRSFKAGKGVSAGSLFGMARDHGWTDDNASPRPAPAKPIKPTVEPLKKPTKGNSAGEVWSRCMPIETHGYLVAKQADGVPLDCLRVVPMDSQLRIAGEGVAGYLAVPAFSPDGSIQSIQFIPANGGKKLNLPGASMSGASFTVGTEGTMYLCEGVGQAWAAWKATGHRAVCCFGAGNIRRIVESMRQREPDAKLVVCPDRGKEADAKKIATEFNCSVACLPECELNNFDLNDLFCRDGFDFVQSLLESATAETPSHEPRYKLLGSTDIRALPPMKWRIQGVLPARGLAGLYGPSSSGKSFLALNMAASIASGERWFGYMVEQAPVVYVCLEGESGLKMRAQAWEERSGCDLPENLHIVLQQFRLTDPRDVSDMASVIPTGAVTFIDTLNRAAPLSDENASRDMGEILEAAKRLQTLTDGLVVVVHHTGKAASAGLRGHSSLYAALDAAVEVTRDGDRREWKNSKCKDGADGATHPFRLQVEELGFDAYGDPITSCTVRADTCAADVQRVKLPQGGNQRLVYEGIRGLFKDGHIGKVGAPPLRPCIELEIAVTAGAARLTCPTDRRATRTREAITGLVARGVLGLNEGWLWTV